MNAVFSISPIFSCNMVLQRGRKIPIWGTAADGETVAIEFQGRRTETQATAGKWRAYLPGSASGGPYEMRVQCAGQEIVLCNVMVGEVWIAGGQSNMEYPLVNSQHGYLEIPAAEYPGIRRFTVPRITHEALPEDPSVDERNAQMLGKAHWKVCSPANAGESYAVAFHFAKELHRVLGVPVGIIECAWGGTSASCWMSEDALCSDPDTKVYMDEYLEQTRDQSWQEYERKGEDYQKAIEAYNDSIKDIPIDYRDMESYFDRVGAAAAYPWPPALGPKSPLRPCGLYQTMFRKIVPFGVGGVIFYQGESDTIRPTVYGKLFTKMMENWRRDLENPNLPFVIVQLAAYGNGNDSGIEYALLREQQSRLAAQPNCHMAVAYDCGHSTNIHPLDKKTVGQRLAAQAEAKVYGLDAPHGGPQLQDMQVEGDRATLSFRNICNGLESRGELTGFQVAGSDRRFLPAVASIIGDKVVISAQGIGRPVAVRYGFCNYAKATLCNSEGFAAAPFRTDDWLS